MPELPEVEILARHLAPLLRGKVVCGVTVRKPKVLGSTRPSQLRAKLAGATFRDLRRRGKYLIFTLERRGDGAFSCLGHLGMTGRMYLQAQHVRLPKHAAIVIGLGDQRFVYEDTRYFGRFTLDTTPIEKLGPEPLSDDFRAPALARALKRSAQAIKVKLLDQSLVAGVGNIYASEALFRAGISPRRPARGLKLEEVRRLHRVIQEVLQEAIDRGSTLPLDFGGEGSKDRLFYFGRRAGAPVPEGERFLVYDREGKPCQTCGTQIRRIVQSARSTFYCPQCQK
jgi:formamidopyrimidine-DNA glycosylase